MTGPARFLRSKVARRIFVVFVVGAVVPILALSLVTSTIVSRQAEEEARETLRRAAKLVAMEIASRLSRVEHELGAVGAVLTAMGPEADSLPFVGPEGGLRDRVSHLTFVDGKGSRAVIGTAVTLPESLGAPIDRPRLFVPPRAGGPPRVVLAVPASASDPSSGTLLAELDPDFLWAAREGMDLPPSQNVVVLDARRSPLYTSFASDPALDPDTLSRLDDAPRGDFDWSPGGDSHLAGYWTLFLKPHYGYAGMTVMISEPEHAALASVLRLSRLMPLVVLIALLGVLLLSLVQIRRQLVPIVGLKEGTRRIAESDFDTRVDISSGDEFQELAESFNTMAARLSRQFKTLRKLAETDRSLLSTLDVNTIVGTVLMRMPSHVPCDCIALTLSTSVDGLPYFRTRFRWANGPEDSIRWESHVDGTERDLLARGRAGLLRFSGTGLPKHLRAMFGGSIQECAVLPMMREGVEGFVTLGFTELSNLDEEALIEARRLAEQVAVALSNAHLVRRLEQANRETLHALARAVDASSTWTAGHSERVAKYGVRLARRLGLDEREIESLHKGALLHDVGKIGVPNDILDKPASLTDEEMALMQEHVRIGARILEPISAYRDQIPAVLYHHERWDGSGYPDGLSGTGIPLHGRILGVVDVFDALSSSRPYRAPWPRERALGFIREGAGSHFDPEIAAAFLALMEEEAGEPDVAATEVLEELAVAGPAASSERSS